MGEVQTRKCEVVVNIVMLTVMLCHVIVLLTLYYVSTEGEKCIFLQ